MSVQRSLRGQIAAYVLSKELSTLEAVSTVKRAQFGDTHASSMGLSMGLFQLQGVSA